MGIYIAAGILILVGAAIGYAVRTLKVWFWDKPVEGVYWKRGLPNIAPGYHPAIPFVKSPKPWPRYIPAAETYSKFVKELESFTGSHIDPPEREMFEKAVIYIKSLEKKWPYILENICPVLNYVAEKAREDRGLKPSKQSDSWPAEPERVKETAIEPEPPVCEDIAESDVSSEPVYHPAKFTAVDICKSVEEAHLAGFEAGLCRANEISDEYLKALKSIRSFCERFVAAAKASETDRKVKIAELVGEAEKILKEIKDGR